MRNSNNNNCNWWICTLNSREQGSLFCIYTLERNMLRFFFSFFANNMQENANNECGKKSDLVCVFFSSTNRVFSWLIVCLKFYINSGATTYGNKFKGNPHSQKIMLLRENLLICKSHSLDLLLVKILYRYLFLNIDIDLSMKLYLS